VAVGLFFKKNSSFFAHLVARVGEEKRKRKKKRRRKERAP